MAHQLAIINDHITADVIEASEFPDMAQRYQVYGVPKTVINESTAFEGAMPERQFIEQVLQAVGGGAGA